MRSSSWSGATKGPTRQEEPRWEARPSLSAPNRVLVGKLEQERSDCQIHTAHSLPWASLVAQ